MDGQDKCIEWIYGAKFDFSYIWNILKTKDIILWLNQFNNMKYNYQVSVTL